MLTALALIPTIVLLVYIYKKDKKEKEPVKLLLKCFFWGALTIIPASALEILEEVLFEDSMTVGSLFYALFDGFLVAALSEELFKYLALKHNIKKSPEFNCTFDGIVYSVFVSLGFATFENIMYVWDSGISTALMRMVTAVPGHMCDAVYMGYFYSKARYAILKGNKKESKQNRRLALLIPILAHGLYDALLSMEEEVAGEALTDLAFLLWVVFVIFLFIFTFKFINKASKEDEYMF